MGLERLEVPAAQGGHVGRPAVGVQKRRQLLDALLIRLDGAGRLVLGPEVTAPGRKESGNVARIRGALDVHAANHRKPPVTATGRGD